MGESQHRLAQHCFQHTVWDFLHTNKVLQFVGDSELVRSWELTEPACRQMKEHVCMHTALVGYQQYTAMLVMVIII